MINEYYDIHKSKLKPIKNQQEFIQLPNKIEEFNSSKLNDKKNNDYAMFELILNNYIDQEQLQNLYKGLLYFRDLLTNGKLDETKVNYIAIQIYIIY